MMKNANELLMKLWRNYRFIALTLLNTVIALLLLNAVLSVFFNVKDYFSPDPVSAKYGQSVVNAVYPGLSENEIKVLLKETWSRPYIYEPFTQFKERSYQGHYVNVDANGFRITRNQGPWPPQAGSLNLFLFGGSTIFGYGVPDDQTVASHLQEHLTKSLNRDVRVYNFGRGHYYVTQERILYEELLTSGFVPDMAIFIDGLNDFYYKSNEPLFTSRFREFMDDGKTGNRNKGFFSAKSIGRAVQGVRDWFSMWFGKKQPVTRDEKKEADAHRRQYDNPEIINSVIKRYLSNKKMIEAVSKPFGVKPIFVWQPVPMYHYDLQHHPFSEGGFEKHSYSQYGYEQMSKRVEKNLLGDNFLWCADIQKEAKGALYVDKVHYSSSFSKQFAINIVDLLTQRRIVVADVKDVE